MPIMGRNINDTSGQRGATAQKNKADEVETVKNSLLKELTTSNKTEQTFETQKRKLPAHNYNRFNCPTSWYAPFQFASKRDFKCMGALLVWNRVNTLGSLALLEGPPVKRPKNASNEYIALKGGPCWSGNIFGTGITT